MRNFFLKGEIGGVVRNISRPEGNITGISVRYLSIAGKWLQLLKEAAPLLARVAMSFYPEGSAGMREG
jgi:putative ABC transport system substrate-binding protein